MKIIAFGHRKRTGKDTAAAYLVENHGFKQYAFAGLLKDAARLICGFNDAQLHGHLKEVEDPFWKFTPRWFLQRFGTEVGRAVHPNLWVRALTLRLVTDDPKRVVISDLRFPNEALTVKALGGWTVRMDRPGHGSPPWWRRWREHASEKALDSYAYDTIIKNDGSLGDLYAKLDRLNRTVGDLWSEV